MDLSDSPSSQDIMDYVSQHVQAALNARELENAYNVSLVPYHMHNGTDSPQVDLNYVANFPAQATNSGKFLTTNGQTLSFGTINTKFGGTGADGALSITSGTTTVDLGGSAIKILNYSSISITTGTLAFTNANASGTLVIIRCSGACTITGSSKISFRGGGGTGGAGNSQPTVATTAQNPGTEVNDMGGSIVVSANKFAPALSLAAGQGVGTISGGGAGAFTAGGAGAVGSGGPAAGAGTTIPSATQFWIKSQYYLGFKFLMAGAGGAGAYTSLSAGTTGYGSDGAGGSLASPNGTAGGNANGGAQLEVGGNGGGGAGGGALYVEVNGALNFTASSGLDVSGGTGGNGGNATGGTGGNRGGSGGGGGGGGTVVLLYNTLTAASGTANSAGGAGGTGGTGASFNGANGGVGGDGFGLVAQNIYYT